ncbi:MAG: hypothetical protein OIN85_01215 [Candidatus Methanoperedens sp.]|nr:hypothetical protein [Candidatus Methanoperedens sp.]
MNKIPRYFSSVKIKNQQTEYLSLGFEKNGAMRLYFQDTAELEQDSNYINETAYPNSGLMVYGMYSMWVSMFSRHVKQSFEDDEIE